MRVCSETNTWQRGYEGRKTVWEVLIGSRSKFEGFAVPKS